MLVVAFVSFSLFNFVGDPINNMVGEETSDEERAELRETLGLMDPIHVQFSRFIVNASKGEFGISYQLRRPVSELIVERLPATIELVVISALIALITGTLLGVYTGINRKGFLSDFVLAVSLLGVSLPTFVIGILFIYLFAVILGVLPSFGRGEVVDLDKRNAAIAKAWKIVKDDISYLPLHHQVISWASKSNVNVPIRPNNEPLFRTASFN